MSAKHRSDGVDVPSSTALLRSASSMAASLSGAGSPVVGTADAAARRRRGHDRRQGGALRRAAAPRPEARRDKVEPPPAAGLGRAGRRGGAPARRRGDRRAARRADEEVVACGLDHQGESVLAWDAETGEPLSPIVVWQDKRSQEVLDRWAPEEEIQSLSGLPFDPYFSAAKLAWLLENEEAVQRARDAGTLRMGTVDSFLCDRLGAGFATDNSTASRTQLHGSGRPASTRACASCSASRPTCCPRCATRPASSARSGTSRGRSSCGSSDRWWTSRRRSPARAASCPGA